jgi:hypothetical protein
MFSGDPTGSQRDLEESLQIFEEVGDDTWGLGNARAGLAGLAAKRGDPVEARDRVLRAIDDWVDQGNALVLSGQLRFLAMADNDAGQPERAVRLAAAAEAWRQKVGGRCQRHSSRSPTPGRPPPRCLTRLPWSALGPRDGP